MKWQNAQFLNNERVLNNLIRCNNLHSTQEVELVHLLQFRLRHCTDDNLHVTDCRFKTQVRVYRSRINDRTTAFTHYLYSLCNATCNNVCS